MYYNQMKWRDRMVCPVLCRGERSAACSRLVGGRAGHTPGWRLLARRHGRRLQAIEAARSKCAVWSQREARLRMMQAGRRGRRAGRQLLLVGSAVADAAAAASSRGHRLCNALHQLCQVWHAVGVQLAEYGGALVGHLKGAGAQQVLPEGVACEGGGGRAGRGEASGEGSGAVKVGDWRRPAGPRARAPLAGGGPSGTRTLPILTLTKLRCLKLSNNNNGHRLTHQ